MTLHDAFQRGERVLLADVFNLDHKSDEACRCCSSKRFWRLRSDAPWTCLVCHPPGAHINVNAIEMREVA